VLHRDAHARARSSGGRCGVGALALGATCAPLPASTAFCDFAACLGPSRASGARLPTIASAAAHIQRVRAQQRQDRVLVVCEHYVAAIIQLHNQMVRQLAAAKGEVDHAIQADHAHAREAPAADVFAQLHREPTRLHGLVSRVARTVDARAAFDEQNLLRPPRVHELQQEGLAVSVVNILKAHAFQESLEVSCLCDDI
jgi:hypothetical protein